MRLTDIPRSWAGSLDTGIDLGDSDTLDFGASDDVSMRWDGTDFDVLAAADDSIIKWGNGTNSFDQWWYGNSASLYFSWDASASDLKFEDSASLMFGTGSAAGPGAAGDVEIRWDGTDLDVLGAADDLVLKVGNGTNSFDLWLYGNTASAYISWDASADDLKFEDSVSLMFGTGAGAGPGTAGDVEIRWDATDLDILAAANNSVIKVGNGTNSFDFWLYGASTAAYVSWDASANDLKCEDSVSLMFGTGAGAGPGTAGDVEVRWDGTDLDILGAADDLVIKFGDGTSSFDLWVYGNIATSYLEWDASTDQLGLFGPVRPRGFNALSRRYELQWVAGQRGKPGINADIQNAAESTREVTDPDFEVLGANGSSDDVTFHVEGGIKLETDGGGTDSVIILPHLDANQTAWAQVTWGTDQQTVWETHIKTGSNITATTIWAGLKLTNTSVTATDDNQAYFRYQDTVNAGKWQAVHSISGTDTETDSTVTVAVDTEYHLKVTIDSARVARFYINGVLVSTSGALTTAVDLIPYVGILEAAAAAKHMYLYGQSISRVYA